LSTKIITAYFENNGNPKTGLSPTIDIFQVSNNAVLINDGALTEIAGGQYKFTYTTFNEGVDIVWVIDGTATLIGNERFVFGENVSNDTANEFIVAWFVNNGVLATGLSPTVNAWRTDTDAQVLTNAAMTEIGGGFYKLTNTQTVDIVFVADGTSTLSDFERFVYGGDQDFIQNLIALAPLEIVQSNNTIEIVV